MAEEKQIKIILNMKRENDKRNPTEKKSLFIVVHHHSWVASQKRLFYCLWLDKVLLQH